MKAGTWQFFCLLAVALIGTLVSAVIDEEREYHGKRVSCIYSGLIGTARGCSPGDYARVFTGTVKSMTEVGDFDKRLEFIPDEVFVGDSSAVAAVTNQGCLDNDIQVGQEWLVFLSRDSTNGTLVLPYQSASKPIAAAGDEIAMLRHLVQMKDKGVIIGRVYKDGVSSINHKIVARNVATGVKYTTSTNSRGHFEFDLPPGSYQIIAITEQGIPEEEFGPMLKGEVPASKGECWEHDISLKAAK